MDSSDPIADYFARYPGFDYDPTRSPAQELKRLCRDLGFLPNTYERANARDEFNIALALKFNRDFGSDVDSLEAWQALCMRIQVDPIPETLSECRRAVKATHVNLVDLVDDNEIEVRKFSSVKELRVYSVKNDKIFPKENAHAGDLLKYLLRPFFSRRGGEPMQR